MRWCPSLLALSLSHLYLPQNLRGMPTLCCPPSGPSLPHLLRDLLRLPLDVFNPRMWDEHAQLHQVLVNLALRD